MSHRKLATKNRSSRIATTWMPLLAMLTLATPAQAQSVGFEIVVNEGNTVTALSAVELSQIFLRRMTRWDGGGEIVPIDLPGEAPVRDRFSEAVHGKTAAQIAAYWQRQVFSGRGVPPAERSSEREVLAFVAATPGAIGYVRAGATLPSGVKVLAIRAVTASAGEETEYYRVASIDESPELISAPPLRYPSRERRNGVEGEVVLEFVVDQTGRVESNTIRVIQSSAEAFESPAIDVVRRASFRPGSLQGRTVPVVVRQAIRFAIERG